MKGLLTGYALGLSVMWWIQRRVHEERVICWPALVRKLMT